MEASVTDKLDDVEVASLGHAASEAMYGAQADASPDGQVGWGAGSRWPFGA